MTIVLRVTKSNHGRVLVMRTHRKEPRSGGRGDDNIQVIGRVRPHPALSTLTGTAPATLRVCTVGHGPGGDGLGSNGPRAGCKPR